MRSDTVSLSSVPFQRPLIFFSSFPSFLPLSFTPLIMSFCLSHPLHRPCLSLTLSPSIFLVSLHHALSPFLALSIFLLSLSLPPSALTSHGFAVFSLSPSLSL